MMKYGAYTTEQSMGMLRSTACGQVGLVDARDFFRF